MMFKPRDYYKPFDFPWAYEAYKKQNQIHWLPDEVPMAEDVSDWSTKLSDSEKGFLTQLFRFFTQGDIRVAEAYNTRFIPAFSNVPELAMMLNSFAAMEAVHVDAYSTLIETLGIPEVEYKAFLEYDAMREKNDFLTYYGDAVYTKSDVLLELALFSAFTEGLQLFSSFAMLLNFPRFGKMKGMGQIVTWSIRDESLHVESMIKLFHELNRQCITDNSYLEDQVMGILEKVVEMEDKFIDLCFGQFTFEGLTKEDVKGYIRYLGNIRLNQLGFGHLVWTDFEPKPLEWLDNVLNPVEHANFFETRSTEYSKATVKGNAGDVQW
jgi:ribonucleoside-diphosphate reductase beta chain